MPLPQKWHKKRPPPPGFDYIEPVLEALENELRDKVKDSNETKRKKELLWPVHQINWQKSRYIYDLFYHYQKISKPLYQYCLDQKLVDAALIAKWKKPGYERLCSTYVINPANYKFGTTSICRVPHFDRSEQQKDAKDPTTGCLGCASGKGAGPANIFGNKYGQSLAAVQIARERRQERQRLIQEQQLVAKQQQENQQNYDNDEDDIVATDVPNVQQNTGTSIVPVPARDDDDDAETDDEEDDNDYGPTPAAKIWAGSKKLQHESERIANGDDDDATTDSNESENGPRPVKRARAEND